MKPIGQYINGNHITTIWNDGTRIQETINPDDRTFTFDYPESFDFKINNKCSNNCPFCHENSNPNGKVPSLVNFIQTTFYNSICPYTEMAIGGGNIFESNDLEILLDENKKRNIISNITVDQFTLVKRFTKIKQFIDQDKVKGIGVSFSHPSIELSKMIDALGNNVVIHVIAGLLNENQIDFLNNKKVLILGYKKFGKKGKTYWNQNKNQIQKNIDWLKTILPAFKNKTKTLSFDCLGIKQMDVQNILSVNQDDWDVLYQGDDDKTKDSFGNIVCSTMYVDLPGLQVARNSTSVKRFTLDLSKTIISNFQKTL